MAPVLAVHASIVDPLPHQITAVYEHMLPRLPLRFLLAGDPCAGNTITAARAMALPATISGGMEYLRISKDGLVYVAPSGPRRCRRWGG